MINSFKLVIFGTFLFNICCVGGCSIRNNPAIRATFYPPAPKNAIPLGTDTPGQTFDHTTFATVLTAHVSPDGLFDYTALAADPTNLKNLDTYIAQLATADINALTRHEQLALYLNAYNAFTLRLILDHLPLASIKDIPAAQRWKAQRWQLRQLGSKTATPTSLDAIEHQIIRPRYADPRIHFALVCASTGCPPLRAEPYTGAALDAQLTDQAKRFFAHKRNFQLHDQTLHLSELLDWFRDDFGDNLQTTIQPWTPANQPLPKKTKWLPYDWSLNQQ